jgi:hypothetical protein
LDFAVDRYRFQFSMIASYLAGFLISGIGFGPIATANSRAALGACGRTAAAVVAAMSKAMTTSAEFNSRFMENLHSLKTVAMD